MKSLCIKLMKYCSWCRLPSMLNTATKFISHKFNSLLSLFSLSLYTGLHMYGLWLLCRRHWYAQQRLITIWMSKAKWKYNSGLCLPWCTAKQLYSVDSRYRECIATYLITLNNPKTVVSLLRGVFTKARTGKMAPEGSLISLHLYTVQGH